MTCKRHKWAITRSNLAWTGDLLCERCGARRPAFSVGNTRTVYAVIPGAKGVFPRDSNVMVYGREQDAIREYMRPFLSNIACAARENGEEMPSDPWKWMVQHGQCTLISMRIISRKKRAKPGKEGANHAYSTTTKTTNSGGH